MHTVAGETREANTACYKWTILCAWVSNSNRKLQIIELALDETVRNSLELHAALSVPVQGSMRVLMMADHTGHSVHGKSGVLLKQVVILAKIQEVCEALIG